MLARIDRVRYLRGYVLELHFSDGSQGEVDLHDRIVGRGGVFVPLENVEFFKQVTLDPEAGTICWPNGVDFCPDTLHHEATGAPLPGAPAASRQAPLGK